MSAICCPGFPPCPWRCEDSSRTSSAHPVARVADAPGSSLAPRAPLVRVVSYGLRSHKPFPCAFAGSALAQPRPEPLCSLSRWRHVSYPLSRHLEPTGSGSNASPAKANHLIRLRGLTLSRSPRACLSPTCRMGGGCALSHTPEPPGSPTGLFPAAQDRGPQRDQPGGPRPLWPQLGGRHGYGPAHAEWSAPGGASISSPGPPIAAAWVPADSGGVSPRHQVRVAPGSSSSRYPGLPGGLAPRPAP